jgi:hypothetical protein
LNSITRFVTWNLDERSGGALRRSLPEHTIGQAASDGNLNTASSTGALTQAEQALKPMSSDQNSDWDYFNLWQLMEEAAISREANRTNLVVGGLVHHIVGQWREQFCRTVQLLLHVALCGGLSLLHPTRTARVYEGEENILSSV